MENGQEHRQPVEKDLEVKKINAVTVKRANSDTTATAEEPPLQALFKRYSTLRKLQTSAAWLLRLRQVLNTKPKQKLAKDPLTSPELDRALLHLVRAAQWAGFPELMQALSAQKSAGAPHAKQQQRSMRVLLPFVDEYGLLRVGGRLKRAGLPYEQTHPLILPRRHELTGLLVHHHHQKGMHRGFNFVLAQLRQRFWVIGGTGTVRHYLAACIRCRHNRAPLGSQQMAPLPASRFQTGHPAFTYTAVDYFGPLHVKVKRSTVKRWGCLMTCLTTRAVHLEVAHCLETDSFLMAFRRFAATYPSVKEMLSDNGTNFVGADHDLKKEFSEAIKFQDLAHGLRNDSVDFRWKFNPPAVSHQGGVFERMIGLVRSCLRQTMRDISYRTPSDESLLTMMKGIEGVLNLRPLLPAGVDPGSFDVLTPAKILRPGTPAVPPVSREFTSSDSLKQGYRSSQWHVDEFWRRFSTRYIPMLQKRTKWLQPQRNFRVNDLVLLQDKNAPRYQWRLALVESVQPNQADGRVRRVTLKLAKGQRLRRDVRSICLLEASPELEATPTESVVTK